MRVFENRVLKRIFGPKRDELTRGWRKLHNEEFHSFFAKYNIRRQWVDNIKMYLGEIAWGY
jgi:hypothetical protein